MTRVANNNNANTGKYISRPRAQQQFAIFPLQSSPHLIQLKAVLQLSLATCAGPICTCMLVFRLA